MAGEMLGPVLVSAHNLTFYQRLLALARRRLPLGDLMRFADEQAVTLGASRGAAER